MSDMAYDLTGYGTADAIPKDVEDIPLVNVGPGSARRRQSSGRAAKRARVEEESAAAAVDMMDLAAQAAGDEIQVTPTLPHTRTPLSLVWVHSTCCPEPSSNLFATTIRVDDRFLHTPRPAVTYVQ
jgi:hypothetical protein